MSERGELCVEGGGSTHIADISRYDDLGASVELCRLNSTDSVSILIKSGLNSRLIREQCSTQRRRHVSIHSGTLTFPCTRKRSLP